MIALRAAFGPVVRPALVAGLVGLFALLLGHLVAADPAYPTPPPAPAAPLPRFENQITPVTVPAVPGATSGVLQPIPQGAIPAIPPLASSTFAVPGHLAITIEAGSLDRTIQLTYVPLAADQVPGPGRLQRLVRVFELRSYDHRGRDFLPELRRPWILEVPINKLPGPLGDPSRLLFASLEGGRWVPLVTSYLPQDDLLVARILQPGRFAIMGELRPG